MSYKPYDPYDENGIHFLETNISKECSDPTISIKTTLWREGVGVEVGGKDPYEVARIIELMYLLTNHIPGYGVDPETGIPKTEVGRNKVKKESSRASFARVAMIRKAQKAKKDGPLY